MNQPQRRSPRLSGYDYAQEGAYFVTICVQNRSHLFGSVVDTEMKLLSAGEMVANCYQRIPAKFADVELDEYVIMPNHFHCILVLVGNKIPLFTVIQWFKTVTTKRYITGVNEQGWQSFHKKLWQRSFHEHIIGDERSLNRFREYMQNNPSRWVEDIFYDT